MITMAYSSKGKPINLPKTGTVYLKAGSYVYDNKQGWSVLDKDYVLDRAKDWDGLTQSPVTEEQFVEVEAK